MPKNRDNHPDDHKGQWDYDSAPDPQEYSNKDGNLNRYSKDYDKWEKEQRK